MIHQQPTITNAHGVQKPTQPSKMASPIEYYQNLRSRNDVSYETRQDSLVIKVQADNERIRLLHLASFYPITIPGASGFDEFFRPIRKPFNDVFLFWEMGAFLAMIHFNQRAALLPQLPQRLQSCDLYMTMEMLDSQFSPIQASRLLYPLLFNQSQQTLETPIPGGLVGSFVTSIAEPISVLAGVYGIPYVSPGVASSGFDRGSDSPTFARTVPSNEAYARAAVDLLAYWNVTHVGLLYTTTDFGLTFLQEMTMSTSRMGISMTAAGYEPNGNPDSVLSALEVIREMKYFVVVLTGETPENVFGPANDFGLVTEDHVWIANPLGSITLPTFTLPASQHVLAKALDGTTIIDLHFDASPPFVQELASLPHQPPLRSFFEQSHSEPFIFDLHNWTTTRPIITTLAYTSYDAVMATGIAACEQNTTNDGFFTGQQHYEQIKATTFDGLSGKVSFDPITGTRRFEGFKYGFTNLLVDYEASDNETIRFKSRLSLLLDPSATRQQDRIQIVTPYVFRGGGTQPPPPLPPLESNRLSISLGVRSFGWGLGGAAMLLSVYLGVWTFANRKKTMLRISQPLFLGMMCFGTFLMASSVLFLGWQEPWRGLNFACMATPWLLVLGFSTAFSALFVKTWRINKLFRFAVELNRANVQAKDVLWPFLLMTVTNVVLLTTWTLVAPLRWTTTVDEQTLDRFGRQTDSFGSCKGDSNAFWLISSAFNFAMVLVANYQSYRGRNVPSDFNESIFVALSMASLLECFLIGAPILWLVSSDPTSDFVIKAVLIAFMCAAIVVPIYFNKFRKRGDMANLNAQLTAYRRSIARPGPGGTWSGFASSDSGAESAGVARRGSVAQIRMSIKMREFPDHILGANLSVLSEENNSHSQAETGLAVIRNETNRQHRRRSSSTSKQGSITNLSATNSHENGSLE